MKQFQTEHGLGYLVVQPDGSSIELRPACGGVVYDIYRLSDSKKYIGTLPFEQAREKAYDAFPDLWCSVHKHITPHTWTINFTVQGPRPWNRVTFCNEHHDFPQEMASLVKRLVDDRGMHFNNAVSRAIHKYGER